MTNKDIVDKDIVYANFAEWFSGELTKRGLTTSAFVKYMGLKFSTVDGWVRGNNIPSRPALVKMCYQMGWNTKKAETCIIEDLIYCLIDED